MATKSVTVRLDERLVAALDAAGASRTEVIRDALEAALGGGRQSGRVVDHPAAVRRSVREDAGAAYRAMMLARQERLNRAGRDSQG